MGSESDETQLWRQWDRRKAALMEASLGKEYHIVMHSIIAFSVGGALDLYYYPNGVPGTAIATREMSELPNKGACNNIYRNYELVMFTRHTINLDAANDETTAFGRAHKTISSILNPIARYSKEAKLNPYDTCECPADIKRVGGKCLIFDGFALHQDDLGGNFGLLAIIEVFRSEMEFARKAGGANLLTRLKDKQLYPYSDLDREPVV